VVTREGATDRFMVRRGCACGLYYSAQCRALESVSSAQAVVDAAGIPPVELSSRCKTCPTPSPPLCRFSNEGRRGSIFECSVRTVRIEAGAFFS